MKRVEKQARDIFNGFQSEVLDNKTPLAINTVKLANYIADKTGYTLEIVTLNMDQYLRGIIVRNTKSNPKNAIIMISEANNECWARFTVVKEVCHLFLEYEKNVECDNALMMAQSLMKHVEMTPNFLPSISKCTTKQSEIEKLLKKLLNDQLGYSSDNPLEDLIALQNPIGAEESAAVVAAIELMIPVINQEWITEQIKSEISLDHLSMQLKVPKLILEYRLNQWFVEYNS